MLLQTFHLDCRIFESFGNFRKIMLRLLVVINFYFTIFEVYFSFKLWSEAELYIVFYSPAVLRSRLRIEMRPTENDLTRLYKNGDISVLITCS